MNKIHPHNDEHRLSPDVISILSTANVKDLSESENQASSSESSPNISVRRYQLAGSKLIEMPSNTLGNIVTHDEYPIHPLSSNSDDNTDLHKKVDIEEEVPKRESMVSEDENTTSHYQNNAENDHNSNMTLALEEIHHEQIATLRTNTFCAILTNQFDLTIFEWTKYLGYTFAIIIFAFAMTLPVTAIPIHNHLVFPEYWYEVLLTFTPWSVTLSFSCPIALSIFLNIDYIKGIRRILRVASTGR